MTVTKQTPPPTSHNLHLVSASPHSLLRLNLNPHHPRPPRQPPQPLPVYRLSSCAACSLTGKLPYPPGPQQIPPNPARCRPPRLLPDSARSDSGPSSSKPQFSSPRGLGDDSLYTPEGSEPLTRDSPTSSCSEGGGFRRHHVDSSGGELRRPNINCRIDHVDRDFKVDVQVRDHEDEPYGSGGSSSSRFSLNCYNPTAPDKNLQLNVEIFKTSTKGFGLRIVQCRPKEASHAGGKHPENDGMDSCKVKGGEEFPLITLAKSADAPDPGSQPSGTGAHNSRRAETRASDQSDKDECRCTSPCGAPNCKAAVRSVEEK